MFFPVLCKQDHEASELGGTLGSGRSYKMRHLRAELFEFLQNIFIVICNPGKLMPSWKGWACWLLCMHIHQGACLYPTETGPPADLARPRLIADKYVIPIPPHLSVSVPPSGAVQDLDRIWTP